MPSLCNSTLGSCPDRDHYQYWTSFYERPFSSGDRLQVYKGRLNGKGPRQGDFSVVKVFRDKPGTEERCRAEVRKARDGAQWLARFLALGRFPACRARVAQLLTAPLDQVSLLNKVLAHNARRLCSGEWILLEEMLHSHGELALLVDKQGRVYRERAAAGSPLGLPRASLSRASVRSFPATAKGSSRGRDRRCRCSLDSRELLEAFVHFTYLQSHGQLVVCGLEGVEDEEGRTTLKGPTIHSRLRQYGETDCGAEGVKAVMERHVCNAHCRKLQRMAGVPSSLSTSTSVRPASAVLDWPNVPQQVARSTPQGIFSAPFYPREVFCGPGPCAAHGGGHRAASSRSSSSASTSSSEDSPEPSAPPYEEDEDAGELIHPAVDDVFAGNSPHDVEAMARRWRLCRGFPGEPPPPYTE